MEKGLKNFGVPVYKFIYMDHVYIVIGTKATGEGLRIAPAILNNIYGWAKSEKLSFNGKKFKRLVIKDQETKLPMGQLLTPEGQPIPVKDHMKILGYIFSDDMRNGKFLEYCLNKAKRAWFFLMKILRTKKEDILVSVYETYARSIAEYLSLLTGKLNATALKG